MTEEQQDLRREFSTPSRYKFRCSDRTCGDCDNCGNTNQPDDETDIDDDYEDQD